MTVAIRRIQLERSKKIGKSRLVQQGSEINIMKVIKVKCFDDSAEISIIDPSKVKYILFHRFGHPTEKLTDKQSMTIELNKSFLSIHLNTQGKITCVHIECISKEEIKWEMHDDNLDDEELED